MHVYAISFAIASVVREGMQVIMGSLKHDVFVCSSVRCTVDSLHVGCHVLCILTILLCVLLCLHTEVAKN
jgi:hypothetical protein